MELKLKRIFKGDKYTIGNLFINDKKFCDTLEDTDRGLDASMPVSKIIALKKFGITAIPKGTYEVVMNVVSAKFSKYKQYTFCGGRVPRLLNVPGYDGVLMHIGNKPEDTDGCILVGKNTVKGMITSSTETFMSFYKILEDASKKNEKIHITIE
jgi:hypothetical protein